jgi:hypothetical protein
MADELIRLDTTIIGIDSLINKASTAEEAKVLFTVKDVIYSQQRYVTDVQPVKNGKWTWDSNAPHREHGAYKCSNCGCHSDFEENYCYNCGARMDGGADDENNI